jgi:hypothetical protein
MRQENVGFVANGDTLLSLRQTATHSFRSVASVANDAVEFWGRKEKKRRTGFYNLKKFYGGQNG